MLLIIRKYNHRLKKGLQTKAKILFVMIYAQSIPKLLPLRRLKNLKLEKD